MTRLEVTAAVVAASLPRATATLTKACAFEQSPTGHDRDATRQGSRGSADGVSDVRGFALSAPAGLFRSADVLGVHAS